MGIGLEAPRWTPGDDLSLATWWLNPVVERQRPSAEDLLEHLLSCTEFLPSS